MRKSLTIILILLTGVAMTAFAGQKMKVSGTVTDSSGAPQIGVSVVVKGTTTGVTTSVDGTYSIECPSNATLVFSYIGMETQEINVGNKSNIDVVLQSSSVEIEGVVAIGYGTMKRKDLTGAISSITASDIESVPVANVAQALTGRIAGVQITQSSGAPDAKVSIRVRGGTSITQENEPLYIIDGFPSEDGLMGIDPSDIESIDVLKDASATAIFGSRGANGIIIITTKSGKKGEITVNYDMYYGFKDIVDELSVLGTYDYVMLDYERAAVADAMAKKNDNTNTTKFIKNYGEFADIAKNYKNRAGINWQKEVFGRKPATQMHKISIRGGGEKTVYSISYTRNDDQGLLYGSGLVRDGIMAKFNAQATDRLKLGFNVSYIDQTTKGIGSLEQEGRFSKLRNIVQYRPLGGLNISDYDFLHMRKDPMLEDDAGNLLQNPIFNLYSEKMNKRNRILSANADLEYRIINGLVYRGMIGMRSQNNVQDRFFTEESVQAERKGGPYGTNENRYYDDFSFNNTLTYSHTFGTDHDLTLMAGQELITKKYRLLTLGAGGFVDDTFIWDNYDGASLPYIPKSDRRQANKLSFFTRANYQYKQRYLFAASLRADGSSVFSPANKWGYFPSVSAAWRMSEENFIRDLNAFSNLKLRFSYGATGNDNIPNFLSFGIMEARWVSTKDLPRTVYVSPHLWNPDLKWETNISANIGFDIGFFRNRLSLTIDWYQTKTKDLLLESSLPGTSGFLTVMKNIGSTRNRGLEVSVMSHNIAKKDFNWNTTFNISLNRNKVLKLAGTDRIQVNSGWSGDFKQDDYLVQVGRSLGLMYGYKTDGIYTVDDFNFVNGAWKIKDGIPYVKGEEGSLFPGSRKYKNIDESNDIIDTNDRTVIGNANPKFFGGMNNTFSYKGFDLAIYMNFSYGNDIYNANRMMFTQMNTTYKNVLSGAYHNRFMLVDANGKCVLKDPDALRELNKGRKKPSILGSQDNKLSDEFIEDGSFLRINNITLGYTFPKAWMKKVRVKSLRIYASINNVATITGYSGYDPEVNVNLKGGVLTPGVDWGAYPRARSYVFGINLSF